MLGTQRIFKIVLPCSWLCLLALGVWGSGIERFGTIGDYLDRDMKTVKKNVIVQEAKDNYNDPDCMRRGCEPPRFI